MTGLNQDRSSHRLLAKKMFHYHRLDTVHKLDAEKADDREIHASVHESERIRGAHDAIEFREPFEAIVDYLDAGEAPKLPLLFLAEVGIRIH